ncbi:MAG: hypothetical protein ACYTAF_04020 [Planctomycetota bacterium]|jgi:uncharacterized delta-60 repeat protein
MRRTTRVLLGLLACAAVLGGCKKSSSSHALPAFNKADGLGSWVNVIVEAGDWSGDVYAGGHFAVFGSTAAGGIVRFNSDGTIDAGFATGTGFWGDVNAIAPAGDGTGDIYVGGAFTSYNGTASSKIIRLNSDGTVDAAFAIGTGFDGTVRAIAPVGDGTGDLHVGGEFTFFNGTLSMFIVRLNSDGTLDAAFATGAGFDQHVYCLEASKDSTGDVYVGGLFSNYDGNAARSLVRLNPDGTIDAGFNMGTGLVGVAHSILRVGGGSGDLYVGGLFTGYNGTASNGVIRLNSDGTVDAAFNVGAGFDTTVRALALSLDGKDDLYAGGTFRTYDGTASRHVVRVNSDGTMDAAFNVGAGFELGVRALCIAGDAPGGVYAGGAFTSYNGAACGRLVRLAEDGTVGVRYGTGTGFNSRVHSILLPGGAYGDVLCAGEFTAYNGTLVNRLVRLNSDGTVDAAFATGTGFDADVYIGALAADGSGDIYVGGTFTAFNGTALNRIVRLNADGTLDTGFVIGTGFDDTPIDIVDAGDGSGDVYAGGTFTVYNGTAANRIVRLNPDGSPDAGFVTGTGFDGDVVCLCLAPDGSGDVYVGGNFTDYNGTAVNRIVRLNSNGTVDAAFAVGTGCDDAVRAILGAADGGGDVYVGGMFTTYNGAAANRIVRLNSDGTVDAAFATGTGLDSYVNRIVLVGNGSADIYVGGDFFHYNGTARNRLVRIAPDGVLNTSFAIGTGLDGFVTGLTAVPDGTGRLFVGGHFTVYDGTVVDGLCRLSAIGTLE